MNLNAANEARTSTIEMRFRVVVDVSRARMSAADDFGIRIEDGCDVATLVSNEIVSNLRGQKYIVAVDLDSIDVADFVETGS
jgi:hypothetical protein